MLGRLLSSGLLLAALGCARTVSVASPASRLDELLAVDRSFATASANMDVVSALTPMFAPDVVMLSAGRVAYSADSAVALLRANPDNAASHMTWRPIGGQVSASGDVGYTYGYFRVDRASGAPVAGKYLAFWTRGVDGWRVAAYKRAIGPRSDTVTAPLHWHPGAMSEYRVPGDSVHRAARLHDAEARFSEMAQSVSIGEAFRRMAVPDAIHTATPNDPAFRFGPDAIKAGLDAGGPPPSRITWASDRERVARSGDIGLTTGWITIERTPGAAPVRVPYFTIWKADDNGNWRFAAE